MADGVRLSVASERPRQTEDNPLDRLLSLAVTRCQDPGLKQWLSAMSTQADMAWVDGLGQTHRRGCRELIGAAIALSENGQE